MPDSQPHQTKQPPLSSLDSLRGDNVGLESNRMSVYRYYPEVMSDAVRYMFEDWIHNTRQQYQPRQSEHNAFSLAPRLGGEIVFLTGIAYQHLITGGVFACEIGPGQREKALQLLVRDPVYCPLINGEITQTFFSQIPAYKHDSGKGKALHIEEVRGFGGLSESQVLQLVLDESGILQGYEFIQIGLSPTSRLAEVLKAHGFVSSSILDTQNQELFVRVNQSFKAESRSSVPVIPKYSIYDGNPGTSAFRLPLKTISFYIENPSCELIAHHDRIAEICSLTPEVLTSMALRDSNILNLSPQEWWHTLCAWTLHFEHDYESAVAFVVGSPEALHLPPNDIITSWLIADILPDYWMLTSKGESVVSTFNEYLLSGKVSRERSWHAEVAPLVLERLRTFIDSESKSNSTDQKLLDVASTRRTTDIGSDEGFRVDIGLALISRLYAFRMSDDRTRYVELPFDGLRRPLEEALRTLIFSTRLPDWKSHLAEALERFANSLSQINVRYAPSLIELIEKRGGLVRLSLALNLDKRSYTPPGPAEELPLMQLNLNRFSVSKLALKGSPLYPSNLPELLRPFLSQVNGTAGLSVVEERVVPRSRANLGGVAFSELSGALQRRFEAGISLYDLPENVWLTVVHDQPAIITQSIQQTWTNFCLMTLFAEHKEVTQALEGSRTARRLLLESSGSLLSYWLLSRCLPKEQNRKLTQLTNWHIKQVIRFSKSERIPASWVVEGVERAFFDYHKRTDHFSPIISKETLNSISQKIEVLRLLGVQEVFLNGGGIFNGILPQGPDFNTPVVYPKTCSRYTERYGP